jgi:type I restriction enzyme S subunit
MYPVSTGIDPRFLQRWLISAEFTSYATVHQGRSVLPKLNREQLQQLPVPVPPLAEQRRIVATIEQSLSRLDASDRTLAEVLLRLEKLPDRVVAESFQGDWPWTTLGEIAEVAGGITKDAKRQDDPRFVEVPYLRVANVQRGYLDLTSLTTIRVSPEKRDALALRPGDVLFNEGGDRDKLGRGWVWNGEIDPCIHQNHVFRARLTDGFEPRFVSMHGNTFGRSWFEANGRQTTNLASLNLTTLKRFPVPAPPLDEQRRIVAEVEQRLSVIAAMRDAIVAAQHRSAALRRSILERAFRGELVPQDPSDEPATVLLERIRAERTKERGGAVQPAREKRDASVRRDS